MTARQQFLERHPGSMVVLTQDKSWLVYRRTPNGTLIFAGRGSTRAKAWKDALSK